MSRSKPTTATSAPARRAIAAHKVPIGPGPKTTMRSPGLMFPGAITALKATAQGSVKAACSNETVSGMRCKQREGTFA